ncbi:MAG: helix-turn-helix domain-containing protein [Gemmatimonadetes bacterium]|nr:helix-turn-helix domain-containing protein [Gemmatimonadota bacterium]
MAPTPVFRLTERAGPIAETPLVTTLVPPGERPHVDAAGEGLFRAVHRSSLPEVLEDLRARRAAAVMVSLGAWHPTARPALTRLVREFPHVPAFAFLARPDARSPQVALQLGQCGVRAVLEANQAHGWAELRRALTARQSGDIRRRALDAIAREVPVLKPDTQLMFERIFMDGASLTSTRDLARLLQTNPSSLMSRFFRLELPSAKRYLATGRLVLVAEAFQHPGATLTAVAHAFRYSSPQSFSRHTRRMFGLSAAQFRERYDADGMLDYFIERLVRPYRAPLARVSPSGVHEMAERALAPGAGAPR